MLIKIFNDIALLKYPQVWEVGVYDCSVPRQLRVPITDRIWDAKWICPPEQIVYYALLKKGYGRQWSKEVLSEITTLTGPCSHSREHGILLPTSKRISNMSYCLWMSFLHLFFSKGRSFYCGFLVFLHDCIWVYCKWLHLPFRCGVLTLRSVKNLKDF